ncbi:MAG: GDP-mannose 4,6-dehydratase [Planctomycetes bacterium]|nr:GDP-mannose 4,6-dehydratase [Planctomycetota bacterium]
MSTYVVIGSNCFTGSHIVDALLDDPENRVIGVSRSPESKALFLPYRRRAAEKFHFRRVDIVRDFPALEAMLEESRPRAVIHVAALSEVALSNEHPVPYFETNTVAVARLCDYLRRVPWLERYVHISSAEILGSCARPATEEDLFNPTTPYAVSKAAADMFLATLQRSFGFPATLIRSTNVYGRHQQLYKIVPRTAIYLRKGIPIELHGGGVAVKSFIHVRDVVRGLLLALERGRPGTYHFSVPSERTIAEIVHGICRKMGFDPARATRPVGERLGQDARYTLDCSKARHELGWEPRIGFEEGVEEVVRWIDENWAAIEVEPLDAPRSV